MSNIIYDSATRTFKVESLQNIAYKVFVKTFGLQAKKIIIGKKYKMLCNDGVNTVPLGKCLKIDFSHGYYANDFTQSLVFTFEKNNDYPLLSKSFYGYDVLAVILNVIEHDDEDYDDNDEYH